MNSSDACSDRVVWCVCEMARRAVAAGCETCEVKLVTGNSTLFIACQDDCPRGIYNASTSSSSYTVDDRALGACRRLGGRVRVTTAVGKAKEWAVMDLVDAEFVEKKRKEKVDGLGGATRIEASVALSSEQVDGVERRLARFLARLVLAASSPLRVCLVRDGELVARLGTTCFTSRIVPVKKGGEEDRMQRALVAYGKSIVEGPTDAVCATASDARSRITMAKFPTGSLFKARTDKQRLLVEVVRIVDGEPLVDGFGKCALTEILLSFDGWPDSRRAKFAGDTPFLRFSLEAPNTKKKKRDQEESGLVGDILIAFEVEASSETLLVTPPSPKKKSRGLDPLPTQQTVGAEAAEYCPDCDAKCLRVLLRSCIRKIFEDDDQSHQIRAIKRALEEMATNTKNPSFSEAVRSNLKQLL